MKKQILKRISVLTAISLISTLSCPLSCMANESEIAIPIEEISGIEQLSPEEIEIVRKHWAEVCNSIPTVSGNDIHYLLSVASSFEEFNLVNEIENNEIESIEENIEGEIIMEGQGEENSTDTDENVKGVIEDGNLETTVSTNETVQENIEEGNANVVFDISIMHPELIEFYKLVEAEAGIESYECRKMVAAVVMNRVNHSEFPNSIHDVIYADGAFSVTTNGALNKAEPSSETILAVNEVYYGLYFIPSNVLYFRCNYYFSWATPYMNIDHTYFSSK